MRAFLTFVMWMVTLEKHPVLAAFVAAWFLLTSPCNCEKR